MSDKSQTVPQPTVSVYTHALCADSCGWERENATTAAARMHCKRTGHTTRIDVTRTIIYESVNR